MLSQYLTNLVECLPFALAAWFFLIFASCKRGKLSVGVLFLWVLASQFFGVTVAHEKGSIEYLNGFIGVEYNLLVVTASAALILSMFLHLNKNVYKHCILLLCMVFTHCMIIYTLTDTVTSLGYLVVMNHREITILLLLAHFWVSRNGIANIIESLNSIRLYLQYSDGNIFRFSQNLLEQKESRNSR